MAKPQSTELGAAFDLAAIEREMRGEENYQRNGHNARTLVREADLRVVLIVMKAGTEMAEHDVQQSAALHILSGDVRLALPDRSVELTAGQLLVLAPGLRHDVVAATDSAFVLTLGWRDKP